MLDKKRHEDIFTDIESAKITWTTHLTEIISKDEIDKLRNALKVKKTKFFDEVAHFLLENDTGDLKTFFDIAKKYELSVYDINEGLLTVVQHLMSISTSSDDPNTINAINLLKLFGVNDYKKVDYNNFHKKNLYLFTGRQNPNPFCERLINKNFLKNYNHVLELGPGTGNDAKLIIDSGKKYTGIDLSKFAKSKFDEKLIKSNNVNYILGDFSKILTTEKVLDQFQDIDVVYSHSTLHYFEEKKLKDILSGIFKILHSKKGLLAMAIKAPGSGLHEVGFPIDRKKNIWLNPDGYCRRFFTPASISNLLEETGFEIIEIKNENYFEYDTKNTNEKFIYLIAQATKHPTNRKNFTSAQLKY